MIKDVSYWATDDSKSESDKSTTESASMEFNRNPENTINPRINFIIACDLKLVNNKKSLINENKLFKLYKTIAISQRLKPSKQKNGNEIYDSI